MNCYLVLWHKPTGTLVHFENLGTNRYEARNTLAALESLLWGGQLEIDVFYAESEEALKRTHGKYWL